jgi:hypothetical protein
MLLMRASPLLGQVGGGWALEIKTFLGPVKWHLAYRRAIWDAPVHKNIKNLLASGNCLSSKGVKTVCLFVE